jgi:hypothetical protein
VTEWSVRRVNHLLEVVGSERYLEIGVDRGDTLLGVQSADKTGVDPHPALDGSDLPPGVDLQAVSSDVFFSRLPHERCFDVIFIDGLHTFEQTYRDLLNSLEHLSVPGFILIDDVWPSDAVSALPDQAEARRQRLALGHTSRDWHGDVYKVVIAIHDYHHSLQYRLIKGSGNVQALVWKERRAPRVPAFGTMAEVAQCTFEDWLALHAVHHASTEEEAWDALTRIPGPQ